MTESPRHKSSSRRRILRRHWVPAAVAVPVCVFLVTQLPTSANTEAATQSAAYLIAVGLVLAQYIGVILLQPVLNRLDERIFSSLVYPSEFGASRLVAIERTLLASPITSDLRIVYAGSKQVETAHRNDVFVVDDDPHDDDTVAGIVIGIKVALQRRVGFSPVILLIAMLGWFAFSGALYFSPELAQLTFFFGSLYLVLWGFLWFSAQVLPTLALKRTAVENRLLTSSEIADLGPVLRVPYYSLVYIAIITGVLAYQWLSVVA